MTTPRYETERMNARPGVPPASMWMALEHPELPEGRSIIALVGLGEPVRTFIRRSDLRHPEPPADVPLGIVTIGTWPTELAAQVLRRFSRPGSGPRYWATIYKQIKRDPQRHEWDSSRELCHEIVRLFVEEVRRFSADG